MSLLDPPSLTRAQAKAAVFADPTFANVQRVASSQVMAAGTLLCYPTQGLSNGTDTGANTRNPIVFPKDCQDLQVVFPGIYSTGGSGETNVPNSYTVTATLEYPLGTLLGVFTFGGSAQGTVLSGTKLTSDPLPVDISAGTTAWVRTYINVSSGQKWPIGKIYGLTGVGLTLFPNQGYSHGTSQTDQTQAMGFGYANAFEYGPCPLAVLGRFRQGAPSVLIPGDSIAFGQNDIAGRGYIVYALNGNFPYLQFGNPGSRADVFAANGGYIRKSLAYNAKYMVDEIGINDLFGGRTLAQLQADKITIWRQHWNRNITVYACTLLPRTTSTDGWVTTANQTPVTGCGPGGPRVGFNDWLRAGAPILISGQSMTAAVAGATDAVYAGDSRHPLSGYFETADTMESARNSCLWIAGPSANYYCEGIHPSVNAVPLIAPAINTALFV